MAMCKLSQDIYLLFIYSALISQSPINPHPSQRPYPRRHKTSPNRPHLRPNSQNTDQSLGHPSQPVTTTWACRMNINSTISWPLSDSKKPWRMNILNNRWGSWLVAFCSMINLVWWAILNLFLLYLVLPAILPATRVLLVVAWCYIAQSLPG